MKILIVSQCYYPDTFLINEIAPRMAKDGHSVTVLTGLPRNPDRRRDYREKRIKEETIDGVRIIRCYDSLSGNSAVKLAKNYLSFVFSGCLKAIRLDKDYDVIFCYQLAPVTQAIPAILYKKLHGVKLFLYCLDIFPESVLSHTSKDGMVYKLVGWLSRKIYNACDIVGVTSKSFINYNYEINGLSPLKQVYIPQHADDSLLSLPVKVNDSSYTDFLFAGNIGYAQNLEVIVNAVELLGSKHDYTVHFVGDGSKLEDLKNSVDKKGLNNKFIFHGRVPRNEMNHFYNLADVLLLTLRGNNHVGETLPGKLQTYMTTGKPIIASINGSAKEVINESDCGLCVPAGDYVALAGAMEQYMNNPNEFSRCGENGRLYYRRNFTFETFMSSVYSVLNELTNE